MPTARETTSLGAPVVSWLREIGRSPDSIAPLTGDVSPRRYYRIRSTAGTAVLATYPPDAIEACARFVKSAALLASRGVPVPDILAVDVERGFMLLRDLGDETLYSRAALGWAYLAPRVEGAAALLPRIASLPLDGVAALNPPLDAALLGRELASTWTLALGASTLAESGLPAGLDAAVAAMVERLAGAPTVPCHRDYMARNLIPAAQQAGDGGEADHQAGHHDVGDHEVGAGADGPTATRLYVIDHQDLRIGPHTYDLASLLNDSLFPPAQLEETLLDRYLSSPSDRIDYHRAAAQRCLKIVGTYLGFARRGEPRHLPLVDPSLDRARHHLQRLPEFARLAAAVENLATALSRAARRR
jgi:aminoglycoside/choline kinase family phosphotransferase